MGGARAPPRPPPWLRYWRTSISLVCSTGSLYAVKAVSQAYEISLSLYYYKRLAIIMGLRQSTKRDAMDEV